MDMMKMSAMASLLDTKMFYLDVTAGITGVILYGMLQKGIKKYKFDARMVPAMAMVLLARVITDFLYHHFVSKSAMFGGSNAEFFYSSVVWLLLSFLFLQSFSMMDRVVLYLSTVIMMMAIARLTHWG